MVSSPNIQLFGRRFGAISSHRVAALPRKRFNNLETCELYFKLWAAFRTKAALVLSRIVLDCFILCTHSQKKRHVIEEGSPFGSCHGLKTTSANSANVRARLFQASVNGDGLGPG